MVKQPVGSCFLPGDFITSRIPFNLVLFVFAGKTLLNRESKPTSNSPQVPTRSCHFYFLTRTVKYRIQIVPMRLNIVGYKRRIECSRLRLLIMPEQAKSALRVYQHVQHIYPGSFRSCFKEGWMLIANRWPDKRDYVQRAWLHKGPHRHGAARHRNSHPA